MCSTVIAAGCAASLGGSVKIAAGTDCARTGADARHKLLKRPSIGNRTRTSETPYDNRRRPNPLVRGIDPVAVRADQQVAPSRRPRGYVPLAQLIGETDRTARTGDADSR